MKTTHNYFSREAAQALIGQYAINSLERIEGCLHWLSQTSGSAMDLRAISPVR